MANINFFHILNHYLRLLICSRYSNYIFGFLFGIFVGLIYKSLTADRFESLPYFAIDYDFIESDQDIASDINYHHRLLSILSPSADVVRSDQIDISNIREQKKFYNRQIDARRKAILESTDISSLANYYMEQIVCPNLVRLGSIGDGNYAICNPWILSKSTHPCTVYSLGVYDSVDFEQDFYQISGRRCRIYTFDDNEESEDLFLSIQAHFVRAMIMSETNEEKGHFSLYDLTKKFGHAKLDILKVDIEGSELSAVPAFFRQFNGTVCQLLIEFHANEESDKNMWLSLFRMLEKRGFRLYQRDKNTQNPLCYQYSYMHLSCFEEYGLRQEDVFMTYFV